MSPRLVSMLAVAAVALSAAAGALAQQDSATMPKDGEAVATFAGGCFWCMEPPYDKLDGVLATISGYTGGSKVDPTYRGGLRAAAPATPRRSRSPTTRPR